VEQVDPHRRAELMEQMIGRLRSSLQAVCLERDELLRREAPSMSSRTGCSARGCLLGRELTCRTPAGDFDGRVINNLPGGKVRVLWFDRVVVYERETIEDMLRPRCRSSRNSEERVGEEFQAELPPEPVSSTEPPPASSPKPRPASSQKPPPASSPKPRPASSQKPPPASSPKPRPASSPRAASSPEPPPQPPPESPPPKRMRQPPAQIDTRMPSLYTVWAVNKGFEGCKVDVWTSRGKGLGVYATEAIQRGELFAFYELVLYKGANLTGDHTYCVGTDERGFARLDIKDNKLLPPEDGIPYVGHLSNDSAGVARVCNCCLAPSPREKEGGRTRRYGLFATRYIRVGEEMLWDYGAGYRSVRPYRAT